MHENIYAGFWIRLAAFLVDMVCLGAIFGLFMPPLIHGGYNLGMSDETTPNDWEDFALGVFGLLAAIGWLYFAIFESSTLRATPGKALLGLVVTDYGEKRISFGRASLRFFAKAVSFLSVYLGFIWVAFDEKKRGFHDIIAGCLVLHKSRI